MAIVIADITQGTDHTLTSDWEQLRLSETLAGITTGIIVVWDPASSFVFRKRDDIKVSDGSTVLFRGQIITRSYTPWAGSGRTITLSVSDYNTVFDERIVGCPDGSIWLGPDENGNYTAVDGAANTSATDRTTLQDLFANYVTIGSLTIDTDTYVNEYIPNDYLGSNILYWDRVTLRQAVDDLDGIGGAFVATWLAPDAPGSEDLALHHLAIPDSTYAAPGSDPLGRMFPASSPLPAAPIGFSETPDGITTFAADLAPSATFDGALLPQQVYVTGATDFARDTVGVVAQGGTGFFDGSASIKSTRQVIISTDAKSAAERDSFAIRVMERGARETVRGSLDYTDLSGALMFHPGQGLVLHYPVSLEVDSTLAIQRVDTIFLTGTGKRKFHIEWGDAPIGRITQRASPTTKAPKQQKAAGQVVLDVQTFSPPAGTDVTVTGQYTNELGQPWAVPDKVVNLFLEVFDDAAVLVCSDSPTNPGQPTCTGIATLTPDTTTTDITGKWSTVLTAPTVAGYTTYVIAAIPVT